MTERRELKDDGGDVKPICREVLAQAFLYIDGEVLTESEQIFVRVHLEECAPCLERMGIERDVTLLIARLRGSDRCPKSLKTRIVALLEDS